MRFRSADSEAGKSPVVLLATAERWISTARMALALQGLGGEVVLLSPGDHPAVRAGVIRRHLRYDPLRPLQSLQESLQTVSPSAILPADEIVAGQLGEFWESVKQREGKATEALRALLTRSLGDPAQLCEFGSRMALQRAAEAEGIPTPATMEITSAGEIPEAFARLGSPLILKADGSSGGRGVRMVSSPEGAQRAYRALAEAPPLPRAVARGLLHRDWTHMRVSARGERRGVSAQQRIAGVERTAMAVAQRGQVLAVECFEVVHTWKLRGPSSVLRRVRDPRMESGIDALARRMQITGFCGFDFIVDAETGVPLLLECNARPTQLAHLSFGEGHDPAAAYMRSIVGLPGVRDRAAVTSRDTIALFPQELQRDPESRALLAAFHDVPWESPALIQHALRGNRGLQEAFGSQQGVQRRRESGSLQIAR